ncbi:transposase [Clostridiales Family XIII bacterium WCA-MUC-591-APC-3H]|uniref:Transposase n=1 Tax=Hornefia butyriciproducens TaxID=2652293 RepID=A0A6L5Y2R9_9FIRM|nr:transposase [Hornefia butyriciproducens]
MAEIDKIHTKHPYMSQRKIVKKLRDKGYDVSRKLVRSYMQEMGIYPIYPKPNLSKRNFKEGVLPYLLRNMHIYMPNLQFVTLTSKSQSRPTVIQITNSTLCYLNSLLDHPKQDFPCRVFSNTRCIHFPTLQVRQAPSQIYGQSHSVRTQL